MPRKIENLYVYITKDKEGNEEMMGLNMNGIEYQCAFSEARVMLLSYPVAKIETEKAGRQIKVMKFTARVDITDDTERKT